MPGNVEPLVATVMVCVTTYLLHSTLLLGATWFVVRGLHIDNHRLKERLWKLAAVAALITTPLQLGLNLSNPVLRFLCMGERLRNPPQQDVLALALRRGGESKSLPTGWRATGQPEYAVAIPRELERICLKALSKRICDRYPTAADMAEDLGATTRCRSPICERSILSVRRQRDSHPVINARRRYRPTWTGDQSPLATGALISSGLWILVRVRALRPRLQDWDEPGNGGSLFSGHVNARCRAGGESDVRAA